MAVTYQDLYDLYGDKLVNDLAYDKNYKIYYSGNLVRGTEYTILSVAGSANFMTVGASANTVGLKFTCTSSYITPTWGTGSLQTGVSSIAIIDFQLDSVRDKLAAIATHCKETVNEEHNAQEQFIIHYTMYRLFSRNQRPALGEDERMEGINSLADIWGTSVLDFTGTNGSGGSGGKGSGSAGAGSGSGTAAKVAGKPYAVMSKPSRIVRHNYHSDSNYCTHDIDGDCHKLDNTCTHGNL